MLTQDSDNHRPASRPPAVLNVESLLEFFESTSNLVGEEFFSALVSRLANLTGCEYALLLEFIDKQPDQMDVRSLAYWAPDGCGKPFAFSLPRAVSMEEESRSVVHIESNARAKLTDDPHLASMPIESYLGIPLIDRNGRRIGRLSVFDRKPSPLDTTKVALLRIFAARAATELVRLRLEQELEASQERFRDLFDEAPIAYVHEGLDSRFIRANRAAMRILGITPDQVPHIYGKTFAPDTPDAQKRLREAFESIGRGTDTSGVVLEMRRKDNGKPFWIQWWSNPDPSGTYTRTMFIDITDKVLMEQEQSRLQAQNLYLREEIKSVHNFDEIVGSSPSLLKVLQSVERVAATDASVLITGETGTGKELVARAIHSTSNRRDKPLIKLNCAALPLELVESELFGHEKGAFSGATNKRIGRFELADGGTIFLDEVGEMTPAVQVKLLRVLQESEFERVGGSETIRVNVRVIAATNRALAAEVAAGRFRSDLFYRLNVFPVHMPPLRDRAEDIPLLTSFFVTRLSAAVGRHIEEIDNTTLDRLVKYHWPGNIRELRNTLERAVILTEGRTLQIHESELQVASQKPAPPTSGTISLADAERQHILATLRLTNGAIGGAAGAAKLLGVPASTLRSRMERLGITV